MWRTAAHLCLLGAQCLVLEVGAVGGGTFARDRSDPGGLRTGLGVAALAVGFWGALAVSKWSLGRSWFLLSSLLALAVALLCLALALLFGGLGFVGLVWREEPHDLAGKAMRYAAMLLIQAGLLGLAGLLAAAGAVFPWFQGR